MSRLPHQGNTLKGMMKKGRSLEDKNAELREGIKGNCPNPNAQGKEIASVAMGEAVQEVQRDVAKLKRKHGESMAGRSSSDVNSECRVPSDLVYEYHCSEIPEDFIITYGGSKGTLQGERDSIKLSFLQARRQRSGKKILWDNLVNKLSHSMCLSSEQQGSTSCVVKLINLLSWAIGGRQDYVEHGRVFTALYKKFDISKGSGQIVCIEGKDNRSECSFLCSFQIDKETRLTLLCSIGIDGVFKTFGLAFTPQDVPVDNCLFKRLEETMSAPDIWIQRNQHSNSNQHASRKHEPYKLYVQHALYLACGTITNKGLQSLATIEILKNLKACPCMTMMGVMSKLILLRGPDLTNTNAARSRDVNTCFIHIENSMLVDLVNGRHQFYGVSSNNLHDLMPSRIPSLGSESCFATCAETLEVSLLYDIKSTDLTLGVALKIQGKGNNSFSAALMPAQDKANFDYFACLNEPDPWNIHDYKKWWSQSTEPNPWILTYKSNQGYVKQRIQPKDAAGNETMGMRNIRVQLELKGEHRTTLSIRTYIETEIE